MYHEEGKAFNMSQGPQRCTQCILVRTIKCKHDYVCLQRKQTQQKRYTALDINISHSRNYVRGKLRLDWVS